MPVLWLLESKQRITSACVRDENPFQVNNFNPSTKVVFRRTIQYCGADWTKMHDCDSTNAPASEEAEQLGSGAKPKTSVVDKTASDTNEVKEGSAKKLPDGESTAPGAAAGARAGRGRGRTPLGGAGRKPALSLETVDETAPLSPVPPSRPRERRGAVDSSSTTGNSAAEHSHEK